MRYLGRDMKNRILRPLSFLYALIFASLCLQVRGQAPVPDSPDLEARAHALLSKLTLEQKIELLGGVDNMYTRPLPAIDLPRFKMSDASVGVRTWGPTTAFAAGASLAASWDTDLARKIGEALGRDARARGVNFLLGPGVNIARSPIAGRNFEYLSEDPYLNSVLVVPFIEGVQSQGVIATVKHYALNDQEFNRHNASADVDERTLREIYLPTFEAAVTKAHVDAVMNSYNLVNGVHSTQNDFLNLQVLKGEWGFQGVLMSDWDATYDAVAACNNGLDLEMPSPKFMNAKNLVPAVQAGQVKEATIDEHVLRLLRAELRYGFTTRPQFDPADSTYSVADRPLALEEALESITLLKNERKLLPLDPAKIKNIAVIGPNVYPAVTGGGGSSEAHAFEPVSILTGIAGLLGPNAHVFYSATMPDSGDEKKAVAQADVVIVAVGFTAATEREGKDRTFTLPAGQDALVEQAVAANPRTIVLLTGGGGMDLSHWLDKVPALLHLYYPGQEGGTAVAQILFGQHNPEGKLPVTFDQSWDANPSAKWYHGDPNDNTMLHTIGAFISNFDHRVADSWTKGRIARVRAIVPGGLMGAALLVGVLLIVGVVLWARRSRNAHSPWFHSRGASIAPSVPSGGVKRGRWLSWTAAVLVCLVCVTLGMHSVLAVKGPDGQPLETTIEHIKYGDKLMVGYRYWTTTGRHPLFPFGFGLSYTTFKFSKLEVPASAASGSTVSVSFDVTNTGKVAGAEVAQLYVSDPSAQVDRPERELKGFAKVLLAPGTTRHVTLTLDARAFSYWDQPAHKWTIDPGKFILRVGDSSENTPLSADIAIHYLSGP
jgi:beta-glucosidase-like glycosyl hydrolase